MHKILILGPQGSGKGTQATILADTLGIPALSMGALLREAVAKGDDFGKKLEAIMLRGELVSDEDAGNVLRQRLAHEDCSAGYVLDGYPRNEAQYRVYVTFDAPTSVIVITVPHDVSVVRLHTRAEREGRHDDTESVIARRLEIYENDTQPMIAHFRAQGIVQEVDGTGTIEDVAASIKKIFV